jgi:hypothetical protein
MNETQGVIICSCLIFISWTSISILFYLIGISTELKKTKED